MKHTFQILNLPKMKKRKIQNFPIDFRFPENFEPLFRVNKQNGSRLTWNKQFG